MEFNIDMEEILLELTFKDIELAFQGKNSGERWLKSVISLCSNL